MSGERNKRLSLLLEQWRDTPVEQRGDFLVKVRLEDEELGSTLQSLVESHTGAGDDETSWLEEPLIRFADFFARDGPAFEPNELLLDRFRIVRFIGKGGMGEVYEAEDMQLGRVALKTIRADLAGNPHMLARFRKEVQLARKVTSTNVCRIHELFPLPAGDRRGAAFLTMEFLEGVSLSERIREGALPLPEAESVALQLCSGVQAIHDAGVVHRDIKSRNVMLVPRNGATQVVVMDLGLARESAGGPDAETDLTTPGAVMGTPQFMAPEQFTGAQATPATDVYELGVLLYEVVTGKLPFPATTLMEAAMQRTKRPPAPSTVRAGVPKVWDDVIGRCLEYEASLRYQSANEVGEALRGRRPRHFGRMAGYAAAAVLVAAAVAGVARSPVGSYLTQWAALNHSARQQLVVLPFDNVGGDPANQALCDGLLEILTSATSETSALQKSFLVIPASEVRRDKVRSIQDARKEFNVNLALTGSVIRSGNSLQLTISLSDAAARRQLASRIVRTSGDDENGFQATLLSAALELLKLEMRPEATNLISASTQSSAAFDLYLKGQGYLRRFDGPPSIDAATSLLERAVQLDPSYAQAHSALAEAYFGKFNGTKDLQWLVRADAESSRAVQLNNRLPQVHTTSGLILRGTGHYEQAAAEFRKAIELDSADFESQRLLARTLEDMGQPKAAENVYLNAIGSKPSYWPTASSLGLFYFRQAQYQKAEPLLKLVTDLVPGNATGFLNLGILYYSTHRYSEAETALRKSIALQPLATAYTDLGTIQFFQQRYSESITSFEKAVQLGPNDPYNWGNLADSLRQIQSRSSDAVGAYRKAIELATQQLTINPNNANLRGSLALYLAKVGERRRSLDEISSALKLASQNVDIAFNAAQVYEISGDHALAVQYLRDALSRGYPANEVRFLPEFSSLRSNPEVQELLSRYDPQR